MERLAGGTRSAMNRELIVAVGLSAVILVPLRHVTGCSRVRSAAMTSSFTVEWSVRYRGFGRRPAPDHGGVCGTASPGWAVMVAGIATTYGRFRAVSPSRNSAVWP